MSTGAADRTLILLRHAKAEHVWGKPDHDRELTTRGQRDARAVGAWLHEHGLICDVVLCSTSMRTRQTWEGVEAGGGATEVIDYDPLIYGGSTDRLLRVIRDGAGTADTLMVVGHAPSIPDLVSMLSEGEGSMQAHQALAAGFPTSGVAVLSYRGAWSALDYGTASLERFHVCRG
ncbi:MAG TPA: histidine phosphatase family protein [Candidatus Lustribacter sp.]|nr:histidine phosphatase family protein [Candidatus Lustribacter sp.]